MAITHGSALFRATFLYLIIARHANREGHAWPKTETLARELGDVSPRSVYRSIALLRRAGAITTKVRLRGDGSPVGLDFWITLPGSQTLGGKRAPRKHLDDSPVSVVTSQPDSSVLPLLTAVSTVSREPDPRNQIQKKTLLPPKAAKSETRSLLDEYVNRFQERFGTKPNVIAGKDASLLSKLVDSHGEPLVRSLLGWFFTTPDLFIRNSGYTIGVFSTCFNKLAITRRTIRPQSQDSTARLEMRARNDAVHARREQVADEVMTQMSPDMCKVLKQSIANDWFREYPSMPRTGLDFDVRLNAALKTLVVERCRPGRDWREVHDELVAGFASAGGTV